MSLYNIPAEDLIGEEIRDVETHVREMPRYQLTPFPDPIFYEFPTNLVYIYYNPRYCYHFSNLLKNVITFILYNLATGFWIDRQIIFVLVYLLVQF